MVTSRRMRWTGHVAFRTQKINEHKIFDRKTKERSQLEDLGVGGKVI
jgi:hypothetical protein